MFDPESGEEIPLKRRDHVLAIIRSLERVVAVPIARHFNLTYSMIGEHHPNARKAGITTRERIVETREPGLPSKSIQTIRVRVRSRVDPANAMLTHGTHVAILLHELAHLQYMNHGREFALLLRDIYRFANSTLGLFPSNGLVNELPSPWKWERRIWDTRGAVTDEELTGLHQEWLDAGGLPASPSNTCVGAFGGSGPLLGLGACVFTNDV